MAGISYTVVSGDCLSGIAKRFGYQDYRTIYNHPDNASFKQKRPNPNLIYPGDVILIPEKNQKSANVQVGGSASFVVKRYKQLLRVKMSDNGEPLKNAPYILYIAGRESVPELKIEGKQTDSDGIIEEKIPPDYINESGETSAEIVVYGIHYSIKIGGLDPISTVTGIKQRLKNLGYAIGNVNSETNSELSDAISLFQLIYGMKQTGEIEDSFRQKLLMVHDNDSSLPPMDPTT